MKYGVRNHLKATVTKVKTGDIMSQVECRLDETCPMSSVLTSDSIEEMNLKEGDKVILLVKAIHVVPVKE